MKTKLILFSIACAFAIQALAQSEDVKYEDILVTDSSNIHQGVLDNGFRYYICNNDNPSNELELRLIQKSGTDDEGGIPGISLLLKRMLCSENLTVGSNGVLKNKLDELQLQRLSQFRAAHGLVPNVSAYCSEIENRCTEYNLFRLRNDKTFVASYLDLLAEIAGDARFSSSELERQKELLVNEINNRRYDFHKAEEESLKAAFIEGCTPDEWANRQVESIRSITLQQLEAYYQKWYIPQNQCLYVFGKAPANIVDMIKQKFGSRPSLLAPERSVNELSDNKLLMVKQDVPMFVVQFLFLKPRVALSETKNLGSVRKAVIYKRFCDNIRSCFKGYVESSMDENDKLFESPLFDIKFVAGLDLYAGESQFKNYIDDVTKKLDDIMLNGVNVEPDTMSMEKRKELQQKALIDLRENVVMDTHSCIKDNFLYSTPLFKNYLAQNYFQYEIGEQDIQDCCKEVFKDYDLRIICTTPYGYPDADIKAKLESVLQHFKQMEK